MTLAVVVMASTPPRTLHHRATRVAGGVPLPDAPSLSSRRALLPRPAAAWLDRARRRRADRGSGVHASSSAWCFSPPPAGADSAHRHAATAARFQSLLLRTAGWRCKALVSYPGVEVRLRRRVGTCSSCVAPALAAAGSAPGGARRMGCSKVCCRRGRLLRGVRLDWVHHGIAPCSTSAHAP